MNVDKDIIEKVLNNTATPEEARAVAAWFAEDEGQEDLAQSIMEDQKGLTEEMALSWLDHPVPEQRMKSRFINQIKQSKKRRVMRGWMVAAITIPFLFLGAFTTFLANRTGVFAETKYAEVYVPCGERMQVMLQDGTVVLLNSDTKLRYPQKFSLFNRTVELSGEGYFDVAKMKTAPFIVDLKGVKVKVTGTKFNVKSYDNDSKIWLTLEEGRVRMNDDKQVDYSLVPGDQVEYDRSSGKYKVGRMDDFGEVNAWRTHSLNFYLTPLKDVLKVLERQYDTRFIVKDSTLLDGRFTLSTAKVSVEDILNDLETVSHVVFHKIGDGRYEVVSRK